MPKNRLRERVVAYLSVAESELRELANIHDGHDNAAAFILRRERKAIVALRDRYSSEMGKLAPDAAQEVRDLIARLGTASWTCDNEVAKCDLLHEATGLSMCLMRDGIDLVGPIGTWRFRNE